VSGSGAQLRGQVSRYYFRIVLHRHPHRSGQEADRRLWRTSSRHVRAAPYSVSLSCLAGEPTVSPPRQTTISSQPVERLDVASARTRSGSTLPPAGPHRLEGFYVRGSDVRTTSRCGSSTRGQAPENVSWSGSSDEVTPFPVEEVTQLRRPDPAMGLWGGELTPPLSQIVQRNRALKDADRTNRQNVRDRRAGKVGVVLSLSQAGCRSVLTPHSGRHSTRYVASDERANQFFTGSGRVQEHDRAGCDPDGASAQFNSL